MLVPLTGRLLRRRVAGFYSAVDTTASTSEEIIRLLALRLYALGYVKESYADAVVEREQILPTGLPLGREDSIAIPHTDPKHVLRSGVALATLTAPIMFANMEEPDEVVSVGTVFLLAIDDKDKQISTLQQIMETIQNPAALDSLKQARTFDDIRTIIG
ncbi:PTS sugar transporter subunit IIA [Paracoccus versutus]|uniref:PTS sugar transporter subunit IIA n=1 Tax=Paracoccus versutus TaxID=34007 RepID=UPI001AD847D7|nr:PTS sugar transporter subunit IIA [Paracoccus versutus]